jgi:transcriptional regulator with GAF, ATPase, and Fis domain
MTRAPTAVVEPKKNEVPRRGAAGDASLDGRRHRRAPLHDTLERVGWHKQRAAEALGITRHELDRLMKKLGIERPK